MTSWIALASAQLAPRRGSRRGLARLRANTRDMKRRKDVDGPSVVFDYGSRLSHPNVMRMRDRNFSSAAQCQSRKARTEPYAPPLEARSAFNDCNRLDSRSKQLGHSIPELLTRHKLLLTRCHILDFHLRPLISIKERDARAQIFGGLELPGDFGWRERVIDAIAAVA